MKNQSKNTRYTEILDELQLQSWQLELVISGFAIFGLFSVLEPLKNITSGYGNEDQFLFVILFFFLRMAAIAMLCNLIIHVFLRSIWIGAIGLRSVSGEIEYEKLNFSSFFTRKLQSKLGSFDSYIDKLERYSSVLFALTILMFFYIIGLFVSLFVPFITMMVLESTGYSEWTSWLTTIFIHIPIGLYYLGLFIIFIDFVTQGFFKKSQRLSRLYYPIYRLYSWVTLSVFYRYLLYNFQDNRFGKNLIKALVPFYLLLLILSTIKEKSSFLDSTSLGPSSNNLALKMNYMDALKVNDRTGRALLDSEIITSNFLRLHVPWGGYLETYLSEYDSIAYPWEGINRGLTSDIFLVSTWFDQSYEAEVAKKVNGYVKGFNNVIVVLVDGKEMPNNFLFYEGKEEKFFLKTAYSLSKIDIGKHILEIKMRESKADSTKFETFATIPFWYFPDN